MSIDRLHNEFVAAFASSTNKYHFDDGIMMKLMMTMNICEDDDKYDGGSGGGSDFLHDHYQQN